MGLDAVIERDLAEASQLFDELAPIAGDDRRTGETMRVARLLAVTLKTHALAEQKVLHELLRGAGARFSSVALQSWHEHHALDVLLDKLLSLRPGLELEAVVAVARRLFELRCEREQRELLPAMHETIPRDEHDQLACELVAAQRRLRPQVERMIGSTSRVA